MFLFHEGIKQSQQVCPRHRSTLPIEHLAFPEQDQCRHRPDLIRGCRIAILIHIHLNDTDLITQNGLNLLQYRMHHFTRLAPGGEKVYQRTKKESLQSKNRGADDTTSLCNYCPKQLALEFATCTSTTEATTTVSSAFRAVASIRFTIR